MSVAVSQAVWAKSAARGSALLVLLALADRANDKGECWPSVGDIARRTRLGERAVRKVLRGLVATGELRILRSGGGRKRSGAGWTNSYLVVAGRSDDELNPERACAKPGTPVPPTRNTRSAYPERPFRGTVTEQSENHQENHQANAEADKPLSTGAVAAADPKAEQFNAVLAERRADTARQRGAMTPKPIDSVAARVVSPRSRGQSARRRGRIPEPEQMQTFTLLRTVPGLGEADARDLARIATSDQFRPALAELARQNGRVRNVGGWLRRAVERGLQ